MKNILKDIGRIILSIFSLGGIFYLFIIVEEFFFLSFFPDFVIEILRVFFIITPFLVLFGVFHKLFNIPLRHWWKTLIIWGLSLLFWGILVFKFSIGIQFGYSMWGNFILYPILLLTFLFVCTYFFVYQKKALKGITFLGVYIVLTVMTWLLPLPKTYEDKTDPKLWSDSWKKEVPCYGIVKIKADLLFSENRWCLGKSFPEKVVCSNKFKPVDCSLINEKSSF